MWKFVTMNSQSKNMAAYTKIDSNYWQTCTYRKGSETNHKLRQKLQNNKEKRRLLGEVQKDPSEHANAKLYKDKKWGKR